MVKAIKDMEVGEAMVGKPLMVNMSSEPVVLTLIEKRAEGEAKFKATYMGIDIGDFVSEPKGKKTLWRRTTKPRKAVAS